MIRQFLAVMLLVTSAVVNRSDSQERSPVASEQPIVRAPASDKPLSIFNDKIRRYRFELDEMLITAETAEQFMVLHRVRNEPPIIGAYADSESNALVVLAPPDAEQPIRETLAKWMVESQGLALPSMNVQKRTLEFRRKELLCAMADVELYLVEAEGDKAKALRDRLQALEGELAVVEKQIEVVNRYDRRLRNSGTVGDSQSRILATDGSAPPSAR